MDGRRTQNVAQKTRGKTWTQGWMDRYSGNSTRWSPLAAVYLALRYLLLFSKVPVKNGKANGILKLSAVHIMYFFFFFGLSRHLGSLWPVCNCMYALLDIGLIKWKSGLVEFFKDIYKREIINEKSLFFIKFGYKYAFLGKV